MQLLPNSRSTRTLQLCVYEQLLLLPPFFLSCAAAMSPVTNSGPTLCIAELACSAVTAKSGRLCLFQVFLVLTRGHTICKKKHTKQTVVVVVVVGDDDVSFQKGEVQQGLITGPDLISVRSITTLGAAMPDSIFRAPNPAHNTSFLMPNAVRQWTLSTTPRAREILISRRLVEFGSNNRRRSQVLPLASIKHTRRLSVARCPLS